MIYSYEKEEFVLVKLSKKNKNKFKKSVLHALQVDQMKKFRKKFLALHPSDQLDLFMTLNEKQRKTVYSYLSPEEFAMIFSGFDRENQEVFFQELYEDYASDMLNAMFTDDVVQFLKQVNQDLIEEILEKMDPEKAQEVRKLLRYEHETAGAIMTREFISISSTDTAGEVIEQLRTESPNAEIIYYNYVVDKNHRLVGVVSLRELITASPEEIIENIMSTQVISVPEDMDQEEVGSIIQKYDLLAAPVVSKDHHLLGIVTVDDVMDILEDETTEDFGEIAAARDATDMNLNALTSAKKRSPWIITLMFFGMITAGVIDFFEETLESVVLLAAFIPMIMDSAGNVGTQSLTVAVRGLALGTVEKGGFWKMIRRELGTGMIIGLACMILISLLIPILYDGNLLLAGIVGVSLLLTLSVSTVVGAVVPLIINRLKLDPAIASGPFITTVNDILGLIIYFSIATALLDIL